MILRNIIFVFIIFYVNLVQCYKYLLVFPYPVKSLSMLGESYVKHLLEAGHQITYISPFPVKDKSKLNFRHILISENIRILSESRLDQVYGQANNESFLMEYVMKNERNINDIKYFQNTALKMAISTFENKKVRELLDSSETFDAVVVDWFQTEIYAGLASLYDCPLIWIHSMGLNWRVLQLVHEATNAAYTSDYLSPNSPPFTLKQRIEELWIQVKSSIIKRFFIAPKEEYYYEQTFKPYFVKRHKLLPNYEQVIYNGSLLFVNEHQASGGIPGIPQNVKLIGGYHINTQVEMLPEDLQIIMDEANDGVIYFSMGSSWQSKDIPCAVKDKLFKVFSGLKQTVIWKYEEDIFHVPDNVKIVKWAPQQSILGHSNCKMFITHGGISSSIEAIHFGVPVIGIPIYIDQFNNINKAVSNGHAIKVDLTMNLADDLKKAIEEMNTNSKYEKRVKELSLIYHDRPIPPGKELVHWMQHVVHTRGAMHLRSPALHVPIYQKIYLDVLVLSFIVCAGFFIAVFFMAKIVVFLSIKINYWVVIKNKKDD